MYRKRTLLLIPLLVLAWPAVAQAKPQITATPDVSTSSPLVVGIVDTKAQGGVITVRCRATGLIIASMSFSSLYLRDDGSYSLYWHWARRNSYTRKIVRFGRYVVTVRMDSGWVWHRAIWVTGGRAQGPYASPPVVLP